VDGDASSMGLAGPIDGLDGLLLFLFFFKSIFVDGHLIGDIKLEADSLLASRNLIQPSLKIF
jgi:hypothetical protein